MEIRVSISFQQNDILLQRLTAKKPYWAIDSVAL